MTTATSPEPPSPWGDLLRVPDLASGEITSDQEFLRQAAEYIMSAVELSIRTGGKLEQNGQEVLAIDIILQVLNAIYEGAKQ